MFSWGPFPTAPAIGGFFLGPVIDPDKAWLVVLLALVASCSALWALGNASRAPEQERGTPRDDIQKKAA